MKLPVRIWLSLLTVCAGCTLKPHGPRQSATPPPGTATGSDTAASPAAVAPTDTNVAANPPAAGATGTATDALPGAAPRSEADLQAQTDIVGYANFCKQELGLPPTTLPPWNCLEGKELPITIEGQKLDQDNYPLLAAGKKGCDRGSWLGADTGESPCINYAFVQVKTLSPDVKGMLFCRSRSFTSWKDRAARQADLKLWLAPSTFDQLYAFDSLGMIWANQATGKACFFDFVGKVYGGYVPSPDDDKTPTVEDLPSPPPAEYLVSPMAEMVWKKNARTRWRSPKDIGAGDKCIECHDGGPWKSSPLVTQVVEIPLANMKVPFYVVGSAFDPWRQQMPLKAISTAPIKNAQGIEEPQICTTCHRIGNQHTCSSHLRYSTGDAHSRGLSELAKSFANSYWMPPDDDHKLTAALWKERYAAHVQRLKCCCENPSAKNCTTQDIDGRTPGPLPPPVPGTGPAVCP